MWLAVWKILVIKHPFPLKTEYTGFCTPIVSLSADAQGDAKTKYLSLRFDR